MKKKRDQKKIYWDYKKDYAKIEWIEDDVIIINGITLELPYDNYDFRD
jgi:hypothetical protein